MMATRIAASSQGYFMLPAFVLFETIRAVITYAAIDSGIIVSPAFILLW
jgi:hypothetical protein